MALYSQLFLRNTTSPYGDFTRNSVLSFKDLDQNFIFLKERDISNISYSSDTLTINTLGGNTFTTTISGGTSSLWSTNVNGIHYNSGNVGIGMSASSVNTKLQIEYDDASPERAFRIKNTNDGSQYNFRSVLSGGENLLRFDSDNTGISPLVVSSANKVGIGTNSLVPQATLHIYSTSGSQPIVLVEDEANPDATPFVIDIDGNVGIGTGAPNSKLEVSGSTGNLKVRLDNENGNETNQLLLTSDEDDYSNFMSIGTPTANAELQFGMIGPSSISRVVGNPNDSFITATSAADDMNFINNAGVGTTDNIGFYAGKTLGTDLSATTSDLIILGDGTGRGNVGLGLSNPSEKLEVSGNTKISGTLNIGTLNTGTSVNNLGIDSNGNVVSGTSSSSIYWTSGSSGNYPIKVINDSTTDATGDYAVAEGRNTLASGSYSHAEGWNTIASGGAASHAEGIGTTASGIKGSHAEGNGTVASGAASHSQNGNTIAAGNDSHAGGAYSTASGDTSFIHSTNSLVTGDRSVVLGGQNITGTTDDTVYVPYLRVIDSVNIGTPNPSVDAGPPINIINNDALYSINAGSGNTLGGNYSMTLGNNLRAIGDGLLVGGTSTNTISPIIYGGNSSNYSISWGRNVEMYSDATDSLCNIAVGDYITFQGGSGNAVFGSNNTIRNNESCVITGSQNRMENSNGLNPSISSSIIGGTGNTITKTSRGAIIGGDSNVISSFPGRLEDSVIIGGSGNTISHNRSVILGGKNISSTTNDTVYVPNLNINNVGGTTPITNLGIDSNGNVVSGSTEPDSMSFEIFNTSPTSPDPYTIYDDGNIRLLFDEAATDDIEIVVLTNPSTGPVHVVWSEPTAGTSGSANVTTASGQIPLNTEVSADDVVDFVIWAPQDATYPYYEAKVTVSNGTFTSIPAVARVSKWNSPS